ncbi:site-specific integrase [Vibrio alfacsensis]|uniref:site-specific integrase n=1 Tax=Vibrio alfacsensis TaxID=1074311 RepID=UPI0040689A74
MYMFKSSSGVYYTRLCLPKSLKDNGFPFDIKISLYTKDRAVAVDRGIDMLAELRPVIRSTCPNSSLDAFHKNVGQVIASQRKKLNIDAPNPVKARPIVTKVSKVVDHPKREKITALLNNFLDSKRLEQLHDLTVHQLKQRNQHFIDTVSVTFIDEVTPSIAMQYRDALLSEGRSHKTNKFYIASVKQFLGWCHAMEHLSTQPFANVKLRKPTGTKADVSRPRWSREELKRCFTRTTMNFSNESLIWALLLMAYHGCRPSEVCQLKVNDICFKSKTFTVTDENEGQHVKNDNARRTLPLHPHFTQGKFVDFVQRREKAHQKNLFDYPKRNARNCAKPLTVEFGKLLTEKGFKAGKRPTAYSFRHTFVDELKKREVAEHVVAQLVGHSHHALTYGHYGKTLNVEALRDYVEGIEFPELEHFF